jgi:hypothetical protein
MQTFASAWDAKEFLAGKIVTEAQREGVSLSEVERKMLYFSETAWTLPDIAEVHEAFNREYDQAEYEKKITQLLRNFRAHARTHDRDAFDACTEAVRRLGQEDHYLLVMTGAAGLSGRPRGDFLKLLAIALAIVLGFAAIAFLAVRYR